VGNYSITVGAGTLSAADYTFAFVNRTLTVTPALLIVTADNKTIVYGAIVPALTDTIAGFVNGDTASVVTGTAILSTGATSASGVGTYPITVGPGTLSAANYTFALVSGNLSVTPATLTVTADDKTKVYGAGNPLLTDTITGFVNSDPASVVSGAPALSTTATPASPVGSYAIIVGQGTLSAANYTFSFVNGTLTVVVGAGLTALDPTGQGSLAITGNAKVLVGAGGRAEILSTNSRAIVATGNATLSAPKIDIEGSPGTSIIGNAKIQGNVASGLTLVQDPALGDPFAALPMPAPPATTFPAASFTGNATATLQPGTCLAVRHGFPPLARLGRRGGRRVRPTTWRRNRRLPSSRLARRTNHRCGTALK